jgi:hypothetical protein
LRSRIDITPPRQRGGPAGCDRPPFNCFGKESNLMDDQNLVAFLQQCKSQPAVFTGMCANERPGIGADLFTALCNFLRPHSQDTGFFSRFARGLEPIGLRIIPTQRTPLTQEEKTMALGFGRRSTPTDFVNFVKYSAMGDRGGTWSDKDHPAIFFSALADFEYIKTGWLLFEAGLPPDFRWDVVLGQKGRSPGKGYKRGLCLHLFFPEAGIGLRELITNNAGVCSALDGIYGLFEHAPERAQGLLPLVEHIDTVPSDTTFGTIYDPVLEIIGWQPRSHELAPPPPSAAVPAPRPSPTLALGRNGTDSDLDDKIPF